MRWVPSKQQNEERGWEQGGGGCCSHPWTTQLGHGCVGISWPLPWGRLQPCHPSVPHQDRPLLAPAAALGHTTEPCSKDINARKEKEVKCMYHLKAKARPGQADSDMNPFTSPLSSDSPHHSLCFVTCFYTSWPKSFSRTFPHLPLQQWMCANIYSSQIQRTGKEI